MNRFLSFFYYFLFFQILAPFTEYEKVNFIELTIVVGELQTDAVGVCVHDEPIRAQLGELKVLRDRVLEQFVSLI